MSVEQALAEVHRHFCAKDGTHDDACVVLREALGRADGDEHWVAALEERARWNARRRGQA